MPSAQGDVEAASDRSLAHDSNSNTSVINIVIIIVIVMIKHDDNHHNNNNQCNSSSSTRGGESVGSGRSLAHDLLLVDLLLLVLRVGVLHEAPPLLVSLVGARRWRGGGWVVGETDRGGWLEGRIEAGWRDR